VVKRTTEQIDAFLKQARDRFKQAEEAERDIRDEALRDLKFLAGDQWNPDDKRIREEQSRPCITINLVKKFVSQVVNEERQAHGALMVNPQGAATSWAISQEFQVDPRDAADIWQGLLRHIEVRSDAECAYDTAYQGMVGNSFGWIKIGAEFASPTTFDQELRVDRILDSFAVYSDPYAIEPDRSDMDWAFEVERISRDEFKKLHPNSNMVSMGFYDEFEGGPQKPWITEDDVQIAKYWWIKKKPRTLQMLECEPATFQSVRKKFKVLRLQDGVLNEEGLVRFRAFRDEYSELPEGVNAAKDDDGNLVERQEMWPEVHWAKITGTDILSEGIWKGRWIPLVPVLGEEMVVDGKRILLSLTRFLRDPQQVYNWMRSAEAQAIALTPIAPWLGAVGQFATNSQEFQNSNRVLYNKLEYDPVVGPNGELVPQPTRNVAEPPIQALSAASQQANLELREVSGIYPEALGEPSNAISGRAIFARKQESDTTNFHFLDNFRRAMRHLGRIEMDLVPHYYDSKNRIIRIVKPDDEHELVMINGPTTYKGKPAWFDPEVGEYDVTVQFGSRESALERTFDMLTQLIQVHPELMNVVGDLLFRSAPLPGHIGMEMADRMKAMLAPPVLQSISNNEKADPVMQGKLNQATQLVQLLQQQLSEKTKLLETKVLDLASKEHIATESNLVKVVVAEMAKQSRASENLIQVDHDAVRHRLDLAAASEAQEADQRHELEMSLLSQAQQAQQPQPQPA
jgi:Phage P22-like portal protein